MRTLLPVLIIGVWLAAPAMARADESSSRDLAAPPSRPLPITAAQLRAIDDLSSQPQHAQAATVRASYSPETARLMGEIGVHATQAILPTTVLTLLLMAAPL
ncbi:MAG TPA: hypothetical protein VM243_17675 [Phycisphaerae bacterium]|nr:hypothetical protein [Phycisphaerae bacterium]